jgi:phospholipid transport system substrate-binding protein
MTLRFSRSIAIAAALAFAPAVLAATPAALVAKAPAPPVAKAAVADPTARTHALIAAFQKVPVRSGTNAQASERAFVVLDGFLDFDALTQEPIRPHAARFDAKQRAEFTNKFREVVRLVAYPDSGEFFRKADIRVSAPREGKGGTWVEFDARSPGDATQTRIGLLWRSTAGGWRVADLTFDGDSLVKDYQNQFGRILEKEGAPGLLRRLDDKRAELGRKPPVGP